jgi:signal peptidase I
MLPTIANPAIVVAVDVPYRSLRKGDIVVYRDSRGQSIQHRLVRKTLLGWIAKGDNNPREDPELVTRRNYIAKVITNK